MTNNLFELPAITQASLILDKKERGRGKRVTQNEIIDAVADVVERVHGTIRLNVRCIHQRFYFELIGSQRCVRLFHKMLQEKLPSAVSDFEAMLQELGDVIHADPKRRLRDGGGSERGSGDKDVPYWYDVYLNSDHWSRVQFLKRTLGDGLCVLCRASENVDIHHTTYAHLGNEETYADSLQFVCRPHHNAIHGLPPYLPAEPPSAVVAILIDECRWFENGLDQTFPHLVQS